MKKLLSLALVMMVCCTSAILLSGCDKNEVEVAMLNPTDGTVQAISITQAVIDDPADYMDKYDEELGKITIKVTDVDKDGKVFEKHASITLLEAKKSYGASVSNFSLKSAGKRTATVTIYGATAEFEYEVTIS